MSDNPKRFEDAYFSLHDCYSEVLLMESVDYNKLSDKERKYLEMLAELSRRFSKETEWVREMYDANLID